MGTGQNTMTCTGCEVSHLLESFPVLPFWDQASKTFKPLKVRLLWIIVCHRFDQHQVIDWSFLARIFVAGQLPIVWRRLRQPCQASQMSYFNVSKFDEENLGHPQISSPQVSPLPISRPRPPFIAQRPESPGVESRLHGDPLDVRHRGLRREGGDHRQGEGRRLGEAGARGVAGARWMLDDAWGCAMKYGSYNIWIIWITCLGMVIWNMDIEYKYVDWCIDK